MKVVIHDEGSNEYLSKMFFKPLAAFMGLSYVQATETVRDSAIIVHGDRLSPERIQRLKDAGNRIICFDINDSSYLSSAYIHSPEQNLVDLIFKVSGVPKQNEVNEVNLDRNFQVKISREKYLPDPQWAEFEQLRPRIRPLPYVLWEPLVPASAPVVPWAQRSGKVLIRGGNHFWRVILAFRLMQEGLLDERSEFATAAYFSENMERRFQYCDGCKVEKRQHGRSLYDAPMRPKECTNAATCWGLDGEFFGGPLYGRHEFGMWNNRCPHSFMWLAQQYEKHRGPLDVQFLEQLFNGDMRPNPEFIRDLSHASFAGDLKWLNTVNLPPRFWEAASVGTPSFYAARTEDQDYWPAVTAGEHYLTYDESMEQFDFTEGEQVSRAVKDLYETKMRGTNYAISDALLKYMKGAIEEIL